MAEQRAENVSLLIDGQLWSRWSEIEIRRELDSFSKVTFTSPFEPDRADFRETFRPFTYKSIQVLISSLGVEGRDFVLFNGTMMGVNPKTDAGSSTVEVTAYALPGVLEDCTMPASAVPFEFKGLGLREIAKACALPFGIGVVFQDEEGARFDKAKIEEDQKIMGFLDDLAKQRGLVPSNTTDGELLFWRSVTTGSPVARLTEGQTPVTSVSAQFDPQQYYSEITGFSKATRKRQGAKLTAPNPYLRNVLRPLNFKPEDTEPADVPRAANAKIGRMFGNVATYTIEGIPTWRDPQDDLYAPNTTLLLTAPGAMIYSEFEFVIRAVTYKQTAESETCSLELVLPGAFSGEVPKVLPWAG